MIRNISSGYSPACCDARHLEQILLAFYGIGPVTVNIFLRELRPFWRKADPQPLPVVYDLATELGIDLKRFRRKTLTFCRIEARLIRQRKQLLACYVKA